MCRRKVNILFLRTNSKKIHTEYLTLKNHKLFFFFKPDLIFYDDIFGVHENVALQYFIFNILLQKISHDNFIY